MSSLFRQKWFQGLLTGAGCAAFSLALWLSPLMKDWENVTWRWRVSAMAEPSPSTDRIKVILIDQASLDWASDQMGNPWPWYRESYAYILNFCRRGGAKVIAFDMLYSEPSPYMAADDAVFGEAIAERSDVVTAFFLGSQSGQEEKWKGDRSRTIAGMDGFEAWIGDPRRAGLIEPRATFPIPAVAESAAMLANVQEEPDHDAVFRRVAPIRSFDDVPLPLLGLGAYLVADMTPPYSMKIGEHVLEAGALSVPLDRNGKTILRYRGPSGTHESLSAAAIIQSELRLQGIMEGEPVIRPEELAGTYVFFGVSAPGLKDLKPTPIQGDYPGVEIHATFLDNLLEQDFLRDANHLLVALVTLLLSIVTAIMVIRSSTAVSGVLWGGLFLAVPPALGFLLYAKGWWWPVMVQEVAVVAAIGIGELLNYATEGRQKRFIKSAFRQYLSGDVIEQIMNDPQALKLGGQKRELTIFFSDLQGFSSISERLGPEDLTLLLNDYLSDMSDIIMEEGGTVDKYEGDAIIAFWNAPLRQEDHAVRACRAALRCQRKLAERRAEFRERTGAEMYMRIGIHTGDVVVGNMGSRNRFNYTVLGDAANLASRLEGANKPFGTFLMVSETTWNQAKEQFHAREIGSITVVGRNTPVRVFDVVGMADEPAPGYAADWSMFMAQCREGRWKTARELLDKCPDDPLTAKYRAKLDRLIAQEESAWDGIWKLTEK